MENEEQQDRGFWGGIGDFFTSALPAVVGSVIDYFTGRERNETEREIAEKNRQLQEETNRQNQANQERAWAREDTAAQRRADDYRAAGISPLLAAGSAAQSSGPGTLVAPQERRQYISPVSGQALAQNLYQAIQVMNSTAITKAQIRNMDLQSMKTDAETRSILQQNAMNALSYPRNVKEQLARIGGLNQSTALTEVNTKIAKKDWDIYSQPPFQHPARGGVLRDVADISRALGMSGKSAPSDLDIADEFQRMWKAQYGSVPGAFGAERDRYNKALNNYRKERLK